MKNRILIITSILFFLIVNTNYFWEGKLGGYAFPIFIILIITYLIFVFILFQQIYFAIRENKVNKIRYLNIGLILIILILVFLKPNGLINFDELQGKDLLIAEREGVANCMTTIKLKENGKFKERNVCFGVSEINGNYKVKNETIFFKNVKIERGEKNYFEFALVKHSKYGNKETFNLVQYKNVKDTLGKELWIIKNDLIK